MKKALLKDSVRQIKNTFKRFLSILLIVLLGVGFFAGMQAASPDMKDTVDKYFDNQNMMDIEVISTLGLTEEDIASLQEIEGVSKVSPAYSFDASVKTEEKDIVVKVETIPENMNELKLLEGSLPVNENECVVEQSFLKGTGYKIGDEITINPEKMDATVLNDENGTTVKNTKIKIVGTVDSPEYISRSRGTTKLGSGSINYYMYIPASNINMSVYTVAYITVDGAKELATYSDEYDNLVSEVKDKIEGISDERKQIRYNKIVDDANSKLDDAQKEYDEQKQKAEDEIADAEKQIADAKEEIENSQAQITSNRKKANTEFANAEKQISQAKQKLETKKKEFETTKKETEAQLAEAQTQLENLQSLKSKYDSVPAQKEQIEKQIESISAQINTGKQQLKDAEEQINTAQKTIESKEKELEQNKKTTYNKLEQAQAKVDSGKAEIEENETKLEESKKEAEEKLAEAQTKIDDARDKISKIEKPTWYILDRDSNYGYAEYMQDTERINNISQVFPAVFFLVAALISLTSMSRMIEEQRVQIGTLKALGYGKIEISIKYIVYAFLATVIGGIIGMCIGFKLLPTIICNMYGMMYTLPDAEVPFRADIGFLGLFVALICTVGATIYTCRKELKEKPAELMLPKAPKPGKRIFLERIGFIWKRLKFTQKVTARNLFRYKKKFLMTIIGVAGCTALIVAGFGIRDSISLMIPTQYGEIFKYNGIVTLNTDVTEDTISEQAENLKKDESVEDTISCYMKTVEITSIENSQTLNLVVVDPNDNLSNFIVLKQKKEQYSLDKDTVIISEKIAQLLNIKVGDTITIKNTDDVEKDVKVGHITENYLYHYIYMSSDLYNTLYGENSYKPNTILITEKDGTTVEQEEKIGSELLKNEDIVTGVTFLTNTKDIFSQVMDKMQLVVYILIASAALLAFAVLYNLSNVNISERVRELATLKVLGFYNKEVFNYITKETRILTSIGIAIGLVGGYFLGMFIIKTCELDMLMFIQKVKVMSFVYGFAITILFAEIVNIAVNHTLKKISMTESLKSVD